MINFVKYCLVAIAAATVFMACSGTVDETVGALEIFADKAKIMADGNDEVTFTVKFKGKDISDAPTLDFYREFDGEKKRFRGNKFTTVNAGTYKFTASYYHGGRYYSDNEVMVVAEKFFTGNEKNYKRRFLGILFTSSHCTSCPSAAEGLKKLQEKNPGVISVAAFHANMGTSGGAELVDPMTTSDTGLAKNELGGFTGLPSFFWDMRKESYTGGNVFSDGFREEQDAFTTFSGVAINTVYDGISRKIDIEVGITSNMPAKFNSLVLLVEDDIPAVGDHALPGNEEYTHHNVVRKMLTSPKGDKINDGVALAVGVEVKDTYSYVLPENWKPENMRVIVAAMTSEGGKAWTANNVNECKVGESVPYLYEDQNETIQ